MMSFDSPDTTSRSASPSATYSPAEGSLLKRMSLPVERFFYRHKNKLVWIHGVMFVFFLAVVLVPAFLPDPPETATPITHFTTFANYAMWGLWFPLVFLSVIFTGRSWCGLLCPMGAASEWANKKGPQRAIPSWLKWEGTPILSFLFITILGQTVGVRDHPEAIAEVFGGTMLAAIVIGFFYGRKKRAWCRHMCPIGLLLGVFSRIGAVQFRPKIKRSGGDIWTEKGVCPTMIDLTRKEESRHCIECFRCVNPNAKGGVAFQFRPPGREVEEIHQRNPNPSEIWFFFLGTGVAIGGFLWLILPHYQDMRLALATWFIENQMYWIGDPGPSWLMAVHPERREVFGWIDFFSIILFMTGFMALFAATLSLTTAMATWLTGKLGAARSFKARFVELGYQYAPIAMVSLIIGLGAELFNGLAPLGLTDEQIGWVKGAVFMAALLWSIRLGYRIIRNQGVAARLSLLPLAPGILGSAVVGLAWWPAIFGI